MRRIALILLAAAASAAQTAPVVRYTASLGNVKYTYGKAQPVATVPSGGIIDTNTLDCFGGAIQKPGDTSSFIKGDNPLTGPFYIEGAEPGDAIAIQFLNLDVEGSQGIGGLGPAFGALNQTAYTAMLHQDLPERFWFYPIHRDTNTATFQALDSKFKVEIPLHPFLGCIGVAPANGEARSSIVPEAFGGNIDSPEASVGNTLFLPVNEPGALLYMGDGHAAMGDGEIAGSAIEVAMKVKVKVTVVKAAHLRWPRFENQREIMTLGSYRPLDDSLRIAYTELIHWIHQDYGLSELDAYELLSKVGKIHLNEMVDPNYVVVTSVEKKYLPEKKK